ncbi:MAG: glycoside hydrolase family 88 protein [Planctomycetaceae bacterium]
MPPTRLLVFFALLTLPAADLVGSPGLAAQERSPEVVAEQLAAVYGKQLEQTAYIPALPLIAKLRLSELTGRPEPAAEVGRILAPFLTGERDPVPKSGSEQAGHLIFAAMADRSVGVDRDRWIALCRQAADQAFAPDGAALPCMPFHNEMSDAVFMAGPILAATGRLTKEGRYVDAAATHLHSMRQLCLRPDGLYRHSPLCDAAWGRGNGFPALGLALALTDWPLEHPARPELIEEFRRHLRALLRHQDADTGCWRQVIDEPSSYLEYSCTCMIGFAIERGIGEGWLEASQFRPAADAAWRAVAGRTSPAGLLVNVCAGTGKQKTLEDYLTRPAIQGRDDRGGAMGLLFAVERLAADLREKGGR